MAYEIGHGARLVGRRALVGAIPPGRRRRRRSDRTIVGWPTACRDASRTQRHGLDHVIQVTIRFIRAVVAVQYQLQSRPPVQVQCRTAWLMRWILVPAVVFGCDRGQLVVNRRKFPLWQIGIIKHVPCPGGGVDLLVFDRDQTTSGWWFARTNKPGVACYNTW